MLAKIMVQCTSVNLSRAGNRDKENPFMAEFRAVGTIDDFGSLPWGLKDVVQINARAGDTYTAGKYYELRIVDVEQPDSRPIASAAPEPAATEGPSPTDITTVYPPDGTEQ